MFKLPSYYPNPFVLFISTAQGTMTMLSIVEHAYLMLVGCGAFLGL